MPAAIVDASGRPRKHPAWVGNPAWSPDAANKILDCPGHRGYIKRWEGNRIIFNMDYQARAGRIYLTERFDRHGYTLLAPHIKENASPNKRWPWDKWQDLAHKLSGKLLQIGQHGDQILDGVEFIETPTFQHALAVIANANQIICHEGGTHHMAASMGKHATVIFGSFCPPQVTGYSFHTNIFRNTPHGFCGNFSPCGHCIAAMNSITVDEVLCSLSL